MNFDQEMIHYEPNTPLFVWAAHENDREFPAHMTDCLNFAGVSSGYSLLAFFTDDWNGAYSPWEADNPLGNRFSGRADETLHFMTDSVNKYLAAAKADTPDVCAVKIPVCIMGYSLAGLYALYSFEKASLFSGAVCCSGSLWYPGFMDYLEQKISTFPAVSDSTVRQGPVYLSLGGREEKSTDPVIASIGDCTRRTDRMLAQAPWINAHTLVMNRGGHFADSSKRLAAGAAWILPRLSLQ